MTDLGKLQRDTYRYFLDLTNETNGLVPDNTRPGSPCSIAAVGFGLAAYPVAVERDYISRVDAVGKVPTLRRRTWRGRCDSESEIPVDGMGESA
jgi:hypothetical protein